MGKTREFSELLNVTKNDQIKAWGITEKETYDNLRNKIQELKTKIEDLFKLKAYSCAPCGHKITCVCGDCAQKMKVCPMCFTKMTMTQDLSNVEYDVELTNESHTLGKVQTTAGISTMSLSTNNKILKGSILIAVKNGNEWKQCVGLSNTETREMINGATLPLTIWFRAPGW